MYLSRLLIHFQVSICDLDSDAGENAAEELGQNYGIDRVLFCHCDVTDYVQYQEAFQTTLTELDSIDIVINNAEIMNDKFWELEVDVNLVRQHFFFKLPWQFFAKYFKIVLTSNLERCNQRNITCATIHGQR